jgi:hypothetical protein
MLGRGSRVTHSITISVLTPPHDLTRHRGLDRGHTLQSHTFDGLRIIHSAFTTARTKPKAPRHTQCHTPSASPSSTQPDRNTRPQPHQVRTRPVTPRADRTLTPRRAQTASDAPESIHPSLGAPWTHSPRPQGSLHIRPTLTRTPTNNSPYRPSTQRPPSGSSSCCTHFISHGIFLGPGLPGLGACEELDDSDAGPHRA